jgi:uncharacterized protein
VDTSKPATGLQIAFLAFAIEFAVAISVKSVANAIGWSSSTAILGNVMSFSIAAIAFVAIRPLREFAAAQLREPVPKAARVELSIVTIAHLAVPLAISGAVVLWAFMLDPGYDYYSHLSLHEQYSEVRGDTALWVYFLHYVLLSIFVGPFLEELVFRGLLYRAWERQYGWFRSMLLTSLVFGLCHPTHMVSTAIGSIIFVCILRRTQTLRGPILAHCTFNFLVDLPWYLERVFVKPKADAALLSSWTLEFACLAFVIVALPAYIWAARTPRQPASMGTHVST